MLLFNSKFYNNFYRAKVWAECCGRSDLATKSNAELHLNYYICSHHIEDRCYVSKTVPVVIEEGTIPTLFSTDLTTGEDSINMFDKAQHLQEVGDSVPLTYCDMNVEIDEYHDIRFANLCRICGKSALDGIDIFTAKGIELKLKKKINLHMPISIDIDDSLPQKVCTDCCNKLEIAHLLVVSCLRTDMRLKKFLNIKKEVSASVTLQLMVIINIFVSYFICKKMFFKCVCCIINKYVLFCSQNMRISTMH